MATPLLMNFLDVARSLGRSPLEARPTEISEFLRREFKARGGLFNYNTSIQSLLGLFLGRQTVEEAIAFCRSHGAPAGYAANADAVRLAGAYALSEPSNCYKIPFSAVPVGRLAGGQTAYMAIKAPLVRVKNSKPYVVVPGFRLGHRPEGAEIDVAASLALATFARDDFEEADYEYLDCSRGPSGTRELRVYKGAERRIFTIDEVDHLLDLYVQGLALAISQGMEVRAPSFRGYHIIDPDQPRMF